MFLLLRTSFILSGHCLYIYINISIHMYRRDFSQPMIFICTIAVWGLKNCLSSTNIKMALLKIPIGLFLFFFILDFSFLTKHGTLQRPKSQKRIFLYLVHTSFGSLVLNHSYSNPTLALPLMFLYSNTSIIWCSVLFWKLILSRIWEYWAFTLEKWLNELCWLVNTRKWRSDSQVETFK